MTGSHRHEATPEAEEAPGSAEATTVQEIVERTRAEQPTPPPGPLLPPVPPARPTTGERPRAASGPPSTEQARPAAPLPPAPYRAAPPLASPSAEAFGNTDAPLGRSGRGPGAPPAAAPRQAPPERAPGTRVSPLGAALPPPVAPPVLPPAHDPLALPPTDAPPVQPGPRSVEQHVPLRERFLPASEDTQLIPVLPPVPLARQEDEDEDTGQVELREGRPGGSRGILRAAGTMAVASLVSRITGLLRTIVLAAALGVLAVNDAYTTANTLPNIVYELLLGGVLTSVVVPLLVHAQERDRDGGVAYAQRLTTLAMAGLTVMTVLAVLLAPLLTRAYGITDPEQVPLANWLARILLVEIVFYGLGALAAAILNSRGVFGWPAWAPVLNNLVVIATAVLFVLAGGPGDLTPLTITDTQVWLLGGGTTLGIAVQALVLLPQLRKVGMPLRPRWGLRGTGLREAGGLGLWVIAYVAISQVGVLVATRVANQARIDGGLGSGALSIASLLFQMPYGILGVALLTALVPRMSRAASRQDVPGVAADLSLGLRLSATGLLPVTALLVVLGPALTVLTFGHGETSVADARAIGTALALGAFGLLPMAVTLLQLRVFYAMKDARTPTLIQIAMVAVRVPLLFAVPAVVEPRHVVAGLMVVTSLTYVTGWVVGDLALRRRLGALRTGDAAASVLKLLAVSVVAGALGWGVLTLTTGTEPGTFAESLATLLIGTVVIGTAVVVGVVLAKVPEVSGPVAAIRSRLGRARR